MEKDPNEDEVYEEEEIVKGIEDDEDEEDDEDNGLLSP